jgi:hypothetical protein
MASFANALSHFASAKDQSKDPALDAVVEGLIALTNALDDELANIKREAESADRYAKRAASRF